MGTRSTTTIIDNDGQRLVMIYRQFDGYPTGMGADIKNILDDGKAKLVNGYGLDQDNPQIFNGMGDLAAYLIGKLKTSGEKTIGNVYIFPPDNGGEEYNYTLSVKNDQVHLTLEGHGYDLYDGPLVDFDPEEAEREEERLSGAADE